MTGMFHPLSLFVGLRYVRARSHTFFVSFITWTSLAGVCVGVAALIVILSVMNGFEGDLRQRLLSLDADARVVPTDTAGATAPGSEQWQAATRAIRGSPGVTGVAPYAQVQALAVRTPEMLPVQLRGIDPEAEPSVTRIVKAITEGTLADLKPGSDSVIIGEVIAEELGLAPGDSLTLLIPTVTGGVPSPKLRQFKVAGVFEVGLSDSDATLVFANIGDVRALGPSAQGDQGLRVRYRDALGAPAYSASLRTRLPPGLEVIDWTQDNADYFRAIRIEKTMMSLILLLIVAVAAFNIVAMLVMVVTDKRTDIAILRTFGASPRRVMGVFLTQGLVIGWLGVALGVALGLVLAFNVGTIVPFLQSTFGFEIFSSSVYYITSVPSIVRWGNVAAISAAALILTAAATVYPAVRASRTAPAEALRYE
ncbi:MAG TPA: lipoprotein-releasing ABC transporter permease subunit [Steroidobacteraceae bacterium]|jgi:lipoprotein-releasing system permease protein|nr:lipoprotein-releasing ABC transporter permease subunit [Steroidobacteraceae bacterium]